MANNIVEMLEQSVRRHGDRPALWDPQADGAFQSMTYQRLWEGIVQAAGELHSLGTGNDNKVGLLAHSRSWWPLVDVAIMSLGAVSVPIYPSLPSNQIEFIVRHSEMVGIVLQDMSQLRKVLEIPNEQIPELRFVVILDSSRDDGLLAQARNRFQVSFYTDWAERPSMDEEQWRRHWCHIGRDAMATIVFTSGTTGVPKGVVLSHGNLLANLEGIQEVVKLAPTDRSLSYLPLSHIFERTCGQFVPLAAGGSIAYARDFHQILRDFQALPPTVLTTVPRLLEKIQEGVHEKVEKQGGLTKKLFQSAVSLGTKVRVYKTKQAGLRLSMMDKLVFSKIHSVFGRQLRAVIVGGAPLPRYVGEFFTAAGIRVAEGYGMTETSPVISANRPESPVLGTAGEILYNVDVRIADDGEVLVKGPSVMTTYFNNEEATKEVFTADGWLKTGDIGRITSTGHLQITDRKKNLIILSTGKKVTPAPIEGDILKAPPIDQVVLVGQGRKYISAIVVPNEEAVRLWFETSGRAVPARAAWADDLALNQYLQGAVQTATADYAAFEQPKKIIVADPFTVDNGLMTPTLKARGKAVLAKYEREIELMYDESGSNRDLA